MQDISFPTIEFAHEDLQPLSRNALSAQMFVSPAFIQLCLDCGCPTRRGLLSAAELLHWLFRNYAPVRELAGLSALPSLAGVPTEAAHRLAMANAVFTILDHAQSRSSDAATRQQLRAVSVDLEAALNRL